MEHIERRREEIQKSILSTYGVEPSSEMVITEEELNKSYGKSFITERSLQLYKQSLQKSLRSGEMTEEQFEKSQEEIDNLERKIVVGQKGKHAVWVEKAVADEQVEEGEEEEEKDSEESEEEGSED
jgi:hypothetical protein